MLAALLVAHAGWDLGLPMTIKSSIGWLKGWALLAIFPLAGACLQIRPRVVVRAMMWLAIQTMALMPFLILAALAHLPQRLFVSPLKAIGGPGPEFFSVYLYTIDPENGRAALAVHRALVAGGRHDRKHDLSVGPHSSGDRRLRVAATIAAVLICVMTKSRMAIIFLVIYPPLIWSLSRISRPVLQAAMAVVSLIIGIVAQQVMQLIDDSVSAFKGARASSSRCARGSRPPRHESLARRGALFWSRRRPARCALCRVHADRQPSHLVWLALW